MAELGIPGIAQEVEIGRGGFGVVYRGVEEELGREVAVKVLPAGLQQRDRDRFDRERRAMGSLSGHPNIVTVHRTGFTTAGQPYIVMEYLERGSMEDRLRQAGPLPLGEALRVGVTLAGAVHSAHQAGILHRDIKPGNVLVTSRGEPKLADFGIARMEGAPETSSSVITASVAHAGPEIIDGRRPSVASDLYSLASTIYTLIAGHPAFTDEADQSIVPLLARIARDPVPPLAGAPGPVWSVLARAMAKDPDGRQPSVEAFGDELVAALRSGVLDGAEDTAPDDAGRPGQAAGSATMVVSPPSPMHPVDPVAGHRTDPGPHPLPRPPAPEPTPVGAGLPRPDRPSGAADGPESDGAESDGAGRSRTPWLVGAAAIVVVVLLGAVVAATRSGGDGAVLPVDTGQDYDRYATAFDASGAIQVSLPQAWSDTDLGGSAVLATITAAADLDAALNTSDEPGALLTVNPERLIDAEAALDLLVDPSGCRDRGRGDYDDGRYRGRFHHLSNCGDADADVWVVVAAPDDDAITIVISVQAVDDRDETAARRILDSFLVETRAVPGL